MVLAGAGARRLTEFPYTRRKIVSSKTLLRPHMAKKTAPRSFRCRHACDVRVFAFAATLEIVVWLRGQQRTATCGRFYMTKPNRGEPAAGVIPP